MLKEAQDLHESFVSEDYSQDVFISTIEKFVSDLKEKCLLLLSSSKEALTCEENVLKQTSEKSVEEESSIVTNDPAERIGVKLNESQNNFLIALGPCQPILESYPMNQAIAKSKQNLFTSKWYESMPFWNTVQLWIELFVLPAACSGRVLGHHVHGQKMEQTAGIRSKVGGKTSKENWYSTSLVQLIKHRFIGSIFFQKEATTSM